MVFSTESASTVSTARRASRAKDLIIVSSELNKDGAGGDPIEIQFIDELKQD